MSKDDPWAGYRPTRKKYDHNDPHFNPFHPPEGTPPEVLEAFWGDVEDIKEIKAPFKSEETEGGESQG